MSEKLDPVLKLAHGAPIDMVLYCPACGKQHIDAPEPRSVTLNRVRDSHSPAWTNPPHKSHLCHGCGHQWRPADVPTNGVVAVKTRGKEDDPLKRPGDDLRFVLAQLALLEDGLTDEDVVWPIRVSFALQAVKKRGLKIEP